MTNQPPTLTMHPPMDPDVQRLLIVGGTFDPPHRAHIELAAIAARQTQSDWTVFIPAARSPHKHAKPTSGEHRLTMLRLALRNCERTSTSDYELNAPPPNYTVHTLQAIRQSLGNTIELRLMIGSDQLRSFDDWHSPDEIVRLARPVVVLRPPDTRASLFEAGVPEHRLEWIIEAPLIELDATTIRHRLAKGENVDGLVDEAVGEYIKQHRLYEHSD